MTTGMTETTEKKSKQVQVADKDALGLRGLLSKDSVKKRFEEVLGREGAVFAASLLSIYNGNATLQKCSPKSILNAGFQAAAMKLPLTPGLGQAAIVPYANNKKLDNGKWEKVWEAQFQIMVRGYIQLAHRSGQYKRLNLAEVHEGELVAFDEFTGVVTLDAKKRTSDKVVGYFFFFELVNGYRHEAYWTVEKCMAHGKKYSKAFQNGKGPWVDMPEVMCQKTVVKNTLAKWGPLSADMRIAMEVDQAVINNDGTPVYVDTTATEAAETYQLPKATDETAPAEAPADPKAELAQGATTPNGAAKAPPAAEDGWQVLKAQAFAKTEVEGKSAFVIKDDMGVKFYTRDEEVYKFVRKTAEEGAGVEVRTQRIKSLEWIIEARVVEKQA